MARPIWRWVALATLIAILALAGCSGHTSLAGQGAPRPPTATATPNGLLPAFADWRIAGLVGPGTLHVYALDGKSDLTGPALAAGAHNVLISPNGRTLAYLTAPKYGPITLLELGARNMAGSTITVPASVSDIEGADWSPDGSQLLISGTLNGATGVYRVDALTGKATLVPGTDANGATGYLGYQQPIAGWTDAKHVVFAGGRNGTIVLDVASGQTTTTLNIPSPLSLLQLAPGGRQALLVASCGACCTVTPDVAVYDFATGAIRHLPNITAATDGQGPALWQPGTSLAVGRLHPAQQPPSPMALFDLATDTVTPLPTPLNVIMLPAAWLPDGQTLLLASHNLDGTNATYYTENPVAPTTEPVPLPASITNVLGFVRTAGGPAAGSVAPVAARHAPAQGIAARRAGGSTTWLGTRRLALPACG